MTLTLTRTSPVLVEDPATPRPRRRYLIAAVIGAVAAAWSLSIAAEPDAGWMLAVGQLVLHGHLPHAELWSWTAQGRPFMSDEWGSAALMAAYHDVFGFAAGLALYQWTLLSAAFGGFAGWALRQGYSARAAAVAVAILMISGLFLWAPRGMLTSVCFLTAEACWFSAASNGHPRRTPAGVLFFGQVLWLSLHGMAIIGVLAPAGLAVMTAAFNHFGIDGAAEHRIPVGVLVRRCAWRAPAMFLTPYGIAGTTHFATVIGRSTAMIEEYQSPNFHWLYPLVAVAALVTAIVWSARGGAPRTATVVAFLTAAGLYSQRYLLLALLFAAPVWLAIAQALITGSPSAHRTLTSSERAHRWAKRVEQTTSVGNGWLATLRRFAATPAVAVIVAIAVVAAGADKLYTTTRPGAVSKVAYPVGATEWLAAHPDPNGGAWPLIAPMDAGGYLILAATQHREGGRLPWRVAWDGRNDDYPTAIYTKLIDATAGDPGWQRLLNPATGVAILAPNGSTLAGLAAARPGFRRAYQDRHWQLWVPSAAATEPLPDLAGPLQQASGNVHPTRPVSVRSGA